MGKQGKKGKSVSGAVRLLYNVELDPNF